MSLWDLQRDYFLRTGPSAWRENIVPSFITTNSFIALAYARLAEAYRPRTIVELGAGSGRFAHHFLKHYRGDARYLLTDVSPANLEACRAHPKFRPFIDEGVLDFALYDPLVDEGKALEGPVLAVANYVFDGLEHDAYVVERGVVRALAAEPRGAFEAVELEYLPRELPAYGDPLWNRMRQSYAALGRGAFLFPSGALRAIENLLARAQGQLLVVAADKGKRELSDYVGGEPAQPARHGSVSFDVNFHALGEHCLAKGGTVLRAPHRAATIEVQGLAFGSVPAALPVAFDAFIGSRGPDEIFTMKKALEARSGEATLPHLLGLLKLAAWDASVLMGLYPALFDAMEDAAPALREELAAGILTSWDRYFSLGEAEDFAFAFGNLLAALGRYEDAYELFVVSQREYGGDEVRLNLELCRQHLRREL